MSANPSSEPVIDTKTPAEVVALDESHLRAARLWVSKNRPYYSEALFRCPIVASDQVPTLGIDQRWRIYVNPAFVNGCSVPRLGAALIHEINHNLRNHSERARNRGIAPSQQMLWNICGDLEQNDDLRADGLDVDTENWMFPERFELPEGKLAEFYYDELCKQDPSGHHGSGQGDGEGDGHEGHNCGGGARGYQQEFEDGAGADGHDGGLSDAEGELLRRKIARNIADHEKVNGRGSVPAGLSRWADELLAPQVNWRTVLAGAVRKAVAVTTGANDYSWQRHNRRQDTRAEVLLPGMVRPIPEIAVVVDTSGSMSQADLAHAVGETQGILRHLGIANAQVKVYAVDAAVHTAKSVFSARQITLAGGGGTDMRVGIAAAVAGKPKPAVVIVLTDGETPWPDSSPVGVKVIAGIISVRAAELCAQAPGWLRCVSIDPSQ